MKIPDALLNKIEKDFDNSGMSQEHWSAYLLGYLACLKRFGGSNAQDKRKTNHA